MAGTGIRPPTAALAPDANPLPSLRVGHASVDFMVGHVPSPVLWAAPVLCQRAVLT
jgi:hypothetical protein